MSDSLRVQFLEQLEKEYQTNSEQIKILTQRNNEIFKIMKEFSQNQVQVEKPQSIYQSNQNSKQSDVIQKLVLDIKKFEIKTSTSRSYPDYVARGDFMFHTEIGSNEFWLMDMKNNYNISKIVLTNRRDGCQERLNTALITILNDSQQLLWKGEIKTTEQKYLWENINTRGRFIKVQLTQNNYLHFADIEVEIQQ